jgi:L-iditol 2-dehydrogenase
MNTEYQKAVVHYALERGAVELRDVSMPRIGDNDVLLHVEAVAVCGSDIHQADNTQTWPVRVPVILGHEFAGTVAAIGQGVQEFREGDRVVSETAAEICGECLSCRSGRYNLCPHRKGFGYGIDGAMTSYIKVPSRCLHHIPDELPFSSAVLTEPSAVAYNAMCVNSVIRPGDLVVIIGPGPIGLLCTRFAALSGANPLIVAGKAVDADRLQLATELGATHTVNVDEVNLEEVVRSYDAVGAELVCEASGASEPIDVALKAVRPDGHIVKVGWFPKGVPFDLNPLVHKNVRLQGSFSHTYTMWVKVIQLLAGGFIMPEVLIGMQTGLENWQVAFDSMRSKKVAKALLIPED